MSENPIEDYVTNSDRGPTAIVIGVSDRRLLDDYTNSVFDNDADLLDLINRVRCLQRTGDTYSTLASSTSTMGLAQVTFLQT